jgi:hypothetical protein
MTTNGGGWTLVAQRNQYGAFNSAWATAEMSLSELASHQPGTDLGSARMASLNVNAFMAATGEDVLRVEKIHAGAGASSLTFDWGQKQAGLVYNPSGTRMFWYTNRFWCTGDGSLCKNHGGLSNGWDISTSTGGNQWLTYYPGGFILDASPSGGVAYNQSGAAWIYLWARSSQITPTIYASCKAILDAGASVGDGPYQIDPTDGLSAPITVYCDMTGGGFTLVAQRNQYGGFDASWGVTAKNVSQLSSYQPSSDLGSARISSLDVNAFMTLTGATTLRVTKRHPSQVTSLDFDWGQRQAALHYTTGGSRMFWYGGRYWCTGDGGNCKDHGGLGNGWDISTSGGTNQWLTYYPGSFMHPAPDTGTVSYNQSGVAWIFLWGR